MNGTISNLSDAELQALYGGFGPVAPQLTGMPDAQLQAMYAGTHPTAGPSGDLATDIGRRLGTGAANAAAGYLALPNLAAQGVDALGSLAGVNIGAKKAIESIPAPGSPDPLLPDFHTAQNMAFHTTGGTEYIPSTWAGRRGQDIINGVMAGTPAQAAFAGPRAALQSLPAMAGGSAIGGQAAETFPEHPMVAALLGAVPGMALGGAVANAPQRIASLAGGGKNTEPFGSFARLGLPTNLGGTVTGDPGLSFAEKFAGRMPGSEGAVANARGDLVGAWQNKMSEIADSLGNATTPQEAGMTLQTGARDWLDQFKTVQQHLWSGYKALVPDNTPVAVPGFRRELNGVLGDFGGADNLAKVLQPQLAAKLKDALGADLQGGSTLTSQSVHSVRTALGQMLENPEPIEGIGKAAIKRLYGGLSDDIAGEAAAAGPIAQRIYQMASGATRIGHGILDDFAGPILQAKSPEQATQFAMAQARQGGTRLEGITGNLPGVAGDLRSYALRNAATNIESPTSLATALTGRKPIYSPEAQQILFGDPALQQQVADLAATGNAMRPFEKDLANSPTATHQTRGLGRIIAAAELAKQGHELAGAPGAVAGGMAGMFAPNIMGRVAQATALNPWLAALYGKQIPFPAQNPSMMARALMAPALAGPRLAAPGLPTLSVPATSASSGP